MTFCRTSAEFVLIRFCTDVSVSDAMYCDMGWLRLVGSLKLQVSFEKETYKRDYILQRRPIILGSLLIVATPYIYVGCYLCRFCTEISISTAMGWLRLVGSLNV